MPKSYIDVVKPAAFARVMGTASDNSGALIKLKVNALRQYSIFLDALASLGSMLVSESVINVFEILSNLGHIFRVCSPEAQKV